MLDIQDTNVILQVPLGPAWIHGGPGALRPLDLVFRSPGKKSPDLGEYDPLTQADSDESEDDLVLNVQQKNGGLKNGKSPLGDAPEPDSDAEAAGAAKPHLSEPVPEGYPPENLGELEQKATSSFVAYVRTCVFLLTVLVSMVLVLVCAFLIPCPPRDLHSTWSRRLGAQQGESRGTCSPHLGQFELVLGAESFLQ